MYILDTDILTITLRYPDKHTRLLEKIQSTSRESLWTSVVTIREMMRGALDVVKREERIGKLVRGYDFLLRISQDLTQYPILPFDAQAERIYQAMPRLNELAQEIVRLLPSPFHSALRLSPETREIFSAFLK